MKEIESRLNALEAAYRAELERRKEAEPFAWIQVLSIMQEDIVINYYPNGTRGEKEEYHTDFDGFIQWVSRKAYKVETHVSHAQSTEYLFSHILIDDYKLAGGEEARQRIIQEWLEEYPYLQRYVDDIESAKCLLLLKPQANITKLCHKIKSTGSSYKKRL